MTRDDARAITHLSRLGVNPVTIQKLVEVCEKDETPLRELVRYILSDYLKHAPDDE